MSGFRQIPASFVALFCVFFATSNRICFGSALVWTPLTNHIRTPHLLTNLVTHFSYTNVSEEEVVVSKVDASCHCTIPQIPKLPWKVPAHSGGKMDVVVEVPGKWGILRKTISIHSAKETNVLLVEVEMLEPDQREKNRLTAFADRQAVFKGDCASCHVKPAAGLKGAALYEKSCGVCHEAEHRASMVPDLSKKPRGDAAYWTPWIRIGKPGTFMPAFDKPHGGPLTEEQIASLLEYLPQRFPPTPAAKAALPLD